MKILWLGPYNKNLIEFISASNKIIHIEEKASAESLIAEKADFVISFGYRYIISKEVIDYYKDRIVNLHISFLPWNRGADPNFWSFFENTPKGITIHYIDEGIDTGDIIVQKLVDFSEEETLVTSYKKLIDGIENLFKEVWAAILTGNNERIVQKGKGSFHRSVDKEKYLYLLKDGWDTKVKHIIDAGKGKMH
ncbi:formyl transferase [bacterium LRH843]|nr:formyl transferase [bacterium LRH843]